MIHRAGGSKLSGPGPTTWVERIEAELGNVRAALGRLQERDRIDPALRLMGAVGGIWSMLGRWQERLDRIRSLASHPEAERSPAALAEVLSTAGSIADILGDRPTAQASYGRALAIYRAPGDRRSMAEVLRGLGSLAINDDDHERARGRLEEALGIARETGDDWKRRRRRTTSASSR